MAAPKANLIPKFEKRSAVSGGWLGHMTRKPGGDITKTVME